MATATATAAVTTASTNSITKMNRPGPLTTATATTDEVVEYIDEDPMNEDDDDNDEEMNILLMLLKRAYLDGDLLQSEAIVDTMVAKSQVVGLKSLHTACGYGLVELVKRLLQQDEKKRDSNCECAFNGLAAITPLHFCAGIGPEPLIDDGRQLCVELLVEHGADVNKVTSRLDTPLHWATKLADFKVCEKLVKLGADVNKLNSDHCTCAHGAAFYKNLDVLEMLIENKCDVNVQDVSGKTILHLLCKASLEEDYLAVSSSDATTSTSTFSLNEKASGESGHVDPRLALYLDSNRRKVKLIKRLVNECRMNVNLLDEDDFNPLMYACEQDNVELVQALVECGADINYINKDGVTCMILAIINSCSRVVKLLLKLGFDLKKNTSRNFSYVTDAAYLNDTAILTLLLEAGCDVNETKEDDNGVILNPLWAACERGNIEIVEMLLARGARTIIREDLKMTALHCACMAQYECLPIVKLLIEHKCPINMKSTSAGETPLFLASNSGYAEIVEHLLSLGVDPNMSSAETRSCFQQAVFRSHKEILILLVDAGYQLNDDDRVELDSYLVELVQDEDVDMLNYLLARELTTKKAILDAAKRLSEWKDAYIRQHLQQQQQSAATIKKSQSADSDATQLLAASLSELRLELQNDFPTTVEELDSYLATSRTKAFMQFSDENDELK